MKHLIFRGDNFLSSMKEFSADVYAGTVGTSANVKALTVIMS
jgi:hypothetical protein